MTDDPAAQAREGLLDTIKGKTKEVAGAVTGNADLVEEGQIQQAEADRRKQAVADEAIAGVARQEADQELREANAEVNRDDAAARAEADRKERLAEQQRAAQHALADGDAKRQEAAGLEDAEELGDQVAETRFQEAEDLSAQAAATEQRTAAEAIRLQHEADAADKQADQLRLQTEK
jgi:uncharacterized protein YjbJ (UPF0337 family)